MSERRIDVGLKTRARPAVAVAVMLALLPGGGCESASGEKSEPPSPIKSDEVVVFLPTIGSDDDTDAVLDIHGWIHEPRWQGAALSALRGRLGLGDEPADDSQRRIFERRARPFLADNERGKRITVRFGDRRFTLNESEPNGHFAGRITLSSADVKASRAGATGPAGRVRFTAVTPDGDGRVFAGEVFLIPPTGVTVISDIDDTIKNTQVRDRTAMLRNTFLRPFRDVPGMAEAYRRWQQRDDVTFHYVSASPWQLYEPLAEFMRASGFPAGPMSLKTFRWKDETFFDLFGSPRQYKIAVIEPILTRFPKRRFVLVGDSGEQDPEAYGELARRHPKQITRILIRDVTDEPASAARYTAAFEDVPPTVWTVFDNPTEIDAALP